MLVEDDADLRELYVDILETNGFTIITANDGTDAVAKYIEYRPDLVLMDIIMPKLSGFEAFLEIKEFDKNAKIVLITGNYENGTMNDLVKTGEPVLCATKPIGMEHLLKLAKFEN